MNKIWFLNLMFILVSCTYKGEQHDQVISLALNRLEVKNYKVKIWHKGPSIRFYVAIKNTSQKNVVFMDCIDDIKVIGGNGTIILDGLGYVLGEHEFLMPGETDEILIMNKNLIVNLSMEKLKDIEAGYLQFVFDESLCNNNIKLFKHRNIDESQVFFPEKRFAVKNRGKDYEFVIY